MSGMNVRFSSSAVLKDIRNQSIHSVTVPPGTIDPSGLGQTSSLPLVVAARPPR